MREERTLTQSLSIKATGVTVYVPGNMISKYLYRYHCVRATTLGSELLNICMYKFIQKTIKYQEFYDYMMHNFGVFLLIIFVATSSNIVFYYFLKVLYTLHVINMVVASMFFGFPISRAKDYALLLPTKDTNVINYAMNEFIEVRTSSNITYSISNQQVAVLAKASSSGTIKIMVYNQSYEAYYHYSISYLNCWIQVVVAFVVLENRTFVPFAILLCYFFWWEAIDSAKKKEHTIYECFLFPFYCWCYICLIFSNDIKKQFKSDKILEQSLYLSYISGNKNSNSW